MAGAKVIPAVLPRKSAGQPVVAETVLHALHLYGAAGIACFGWAVCRLLGCAATPWLPLWFAAGLFVYNLDRLRVDPADRLNTPMRAAATEWLRAWSRGVILLAGGFLFLWPALRADWLTLLATVGGSAIVVFYPVPLGRKRLKDVPLLKTFLPPGFVIAAAFALPLSHEPWRLRPGYTFWMVLWASGLLLGNMVLCDLRDVTGDRLAGVMSLPGFLGPRRTRRLLWFLVALAVGAALLAASSSSPVLQPRWYALAVVSPAYLAALIYATRGQRSERFYERWVEGILFIPGFVLLLMEI